MYCGNLNKIYNINSKRAQNIQGTVHQRRQSRLIIIIQQATNNFQLGVSTMPRPATLTDCFCSNTAAVVIATIKIRNVCATFSESMKKYMYALQALAFIHGGTYAIRIAL
jgi:hypothetical protein